MGLIPRDLDSPPFGLNVEDLAGVPVDRVRLEQGLIERVPSDHDTKRGLRDLADGRFDVLDGDDRRDGINHR